MHKIQISNIHGHGDGEAVELRVEVLKYTEILLARSKISKCATKLFYMQENHRKLCGGKKGLASLLALKEPLAHMPQLWASNLDFLPFYAQEHEGGGGKNERSWRG
ncbi:hypothetical protein ACJX0J_030100 [Zea mays]